MSIIEVLNETRNRTSMARKSKSRNAGSNTQQNSKQGGYSNEPKAYPSKSYGAREEHNSGNRVTSNSNENAWVRSRHSSVSDMWSDPDEHFPTLGASAAPGPNVNVWEERKSKQDAIKALEPQNEYDEEAMLQHALAMSLIAATEEEQKRKKMEEDYMMQLEALQCSSEDLDAPDEFLGKETLKHENDIFVEERHQLKNCFRNSASVSSQNEKYTNCESSKFQDDFSSKEPYQLENCSGNSLANNSQKGKTYKGARPKINKAIAAFGGWGLKEDKRKNSSENLSEFLDDVVSEKSNSCNRTYTNQENVKESDNSNKEKVLHSTDLKNAKEKSDCNSEVLYDSKGTFIDDDDEILDDSENKLVSPNKALDSWLNSEDVDDWNDDEVLDKKKATTLNDKSTDDFIPTSYNDKLKTEDEKNGILSTSIEYSIPTITKDYEPKIVKDSHTFLPKTSESVKSVWSNTNNYEDKELSENKNLYAYDACDNANTFTPFHEPTEVPTLTSCKIWSDKSSSDSSYFSSFSDNLAGKVESIKLSNDVENEVFNIASSSDSDVPPIRPPQPPTSVSPENECNASASTNFNSEMNSIPIPQPQPIPKIQAPPFPTFVAPIFNPLFPALNPMLGCGMDPLLMRKMLILSNPFLANQLLVMEQYYRSLGIAVDLFSMNPAMPNIPGMLNPSLMQIPLANNVDGNIQQLQSEIQQLQTQIDASAASVSNTVANIEQKSCEKSHEPAGLDSDLDFNKSPSLVEDVNDDEWFKSYLSNANESIIPPPKPPSNGVNLMPVPHKSDLDLVVPSYDNKVAHSQAPDCSAVSSSVTNINRLLPTSGSGIPKKEVSGWGDLGDDLDDAQNLKSGIWDDGWGDAIAPPKPLRNPSHQEEKKKTVFRQPAKQPQISRYQRNFTRS